MATSFLNWEFVFSCQIVGNVRFFWQIRVPLSEIHPIPFQEGRSGTTHPHRVQVEKHYYNCSHHSYQFDLCCDDTNSHIKYPIQTNKSTFHMLIYDCILRSLIIWTSIPQKKYKNQSFVITVGIWRNNFI